MGEIGQPSLCCEFGDRNIAFYQATGEVTQAGIGHQCGRRGVEQFSADPRHMFTAAAAGVHQRLGACAPTALFQGLKTLFEPAWECTSSRAITQQAQGFQQQSVAGQGITPALVQITGGEAQAAQLSRIKSAHPLCQREAQRISTSAVAVDEGAPQLHTEREIREQKRFPRSRRKAMPIGSVHQAKRTWCQGDVAVWSGHDAASGLDPE